jgi:hypothetical protein
MCPLSCWPRSDAECFGAFRCSCGIPEKLVADLDLCPNGIHASSPALYVQRRESCQLQPLQPGKDKPARWFKRSCAIAASHSRLSDTRCYVNYVAYFSGM